MMTKKELQAQLEQTVIELYRSGKTQKEVAKQVGISDKTVRKILKKYSISQNVSQKQLDFLFSLLTQNFEVKDFIKLKQDLNMLSLKQVRGMIMTLTRYEKLKKQLKETENKLKYYQKMFNIQKKE